jgi:hypothetical protein
MTVSDGPFESSKHEHIFVLMIDSNYPMQSFPLGKFATGFETEIHAILQCACENIRRAYKHMRILNLLATDFFFKF